MNILEMKNITKAFPGVIALDDVSLSVKKGEIHALLGENGAGKSTLIKVLNGFLKADKGRIYYKGKEHHIKNTLDAGEKGIGFIFQEFNLISCLSVEENIFLGRPLKKKGGRVDWKAMKLRTQEVLDSLGFNIKPEEIVENLSVAEKQMVEIAKALSMNIELIVMDEPTAVLTKNELNKLFEIIRDLKSTGVTVIYISHRLEEIFALCDRVTVLRDGKHIYTGDVASLSKERMIELMVGRSISQEFPQRDYCSAEEVMRVDNLSRKGKLENISFSLNKGEILGFAGLVGSGRTELVRAIFGADAIDDGTIQLYGKHVKIKSPKDAMKHGIALLPEDRKEQGLINGFSVEWNISISNIKNICTNLKLKILSKSKERKVAAEYIERVNIKTPTAKRIAVFLSGGNQQKTVIAKWLFAEMDILILDEPTRGIDVGAKYEIYLLLNELVKQGKSIILISSELPEVIALSDRILVMNSGKISCELSREEITPEEVIKHAISEV